MHAGWGHGWPQSLGFRLGQSSEECDVVISLYSADWPFVIFKVLTGEHLRQAHSRKSRCFFNGLLHLRYIRATMEHGSLATMVFAEFRGFDLVNLQALLAEHDT